MRVSAENGMNVAAGCAELAAAQAVALLRQHDDRPPLRRLVGQARELGGVGEFLRRARRGPG